MSEAPKSDGNLRGVSPATRFPPIASFDNLSEDDLWDGLLADAAAEAASGRRVNLRRYLDSFPDIKSRPEAIQAMIAATLENARRMGVGQEEALDEIRRANPQYSQQIDQAELTEELLGLDEDDEYELESARDLPCEYGPIGLDERPRYVLHQLLGIGTRGCVYKAIDRTMSSPDSPSWVAIKTIPEWTGMQERDVLAEARRARRIESESVARILDAGVHDENECYIVCEFVDGTTLAESRESSSLQGQQAASVRLFLPVIDAMREAHMSGMSHLDIHPRNILIDRHGRAKLIDFGLGLTKFEAWKPAKRPLGSLGFMPPEIYNRDPDLTLHRADVYSLAGLLLWLVTGEVPNGQTVEEAEFRLNSSGEKSPREAEITVPVTIDPSLASILKRSLHADPSLRYATAHGLASDLHAWLEHRPIPWIHTSLKQRAVLLARRSPGVMLATAAALAVLIIATVIITNQVVQHDAELRVAVAQRAESLAKADAERMAERAAVADKMDAFASSMRGFVLSGSVPRAAGRDWVVILSLVKDLSDDGLELDADVLGSALQQRIEIARERVAEAVTTKGEKDIQTGLWRAALACWLVDAEQYELASQELKLAVEYWGTSGPEGASLTQNLTVLSDAVAVLADTRQEHSSEDARTILESDRAALLPAKVRVQLTDLVSMDDQPESQSASDQSDPSKP